MIPLSPTDVDELLNELDLACLEIEEVGDYSLVAPVSRIIRCKGILHTAMRSFEEDIDSMFREYNKQRVGDEQEPG